METGLPSLAPPQRPNKIAAKQERAFRQLRRKACGVGARARTHWGKLNSSRRWLFTSKQVVKPAQTQHLAAASNSFLSAVEAALGLL